MPEFNVDVDEFVWSCSEREIKTLIKELVEREYLPKGIINEKGEVKKELGRKTANEIDFMDKLDKLKNKFFSLSQEEEEFFERIFKKHL